MRASQLIEMTTSELQEKLRKEREALFKLRFRSAAGKLSNPMKKRSTKREIARILTIIGNKQKGAKE